MGRAERVVPVGHDHDVPVAHLPDSVPRPVAAVHPLDGPSLGSPEAVVVDLLKDGLDGHVIDVMLVRRPARPVAGRRQDLDDLETIAGKRRRDDVVDLAARVAGATDLDCDVTRTHHDRVRRDTVATGTWSAGDGDRAGSRTHVDVQLPAVGEPQRRRQIGEWIVPTFEQPPTPFGLDRDVAASTTVPSSPTARLSKDR